MEAVRRYEPPVKPRRWVPLEEDLEGVVIGVPAETTRGEALCAADVSAAEQAPAQP